MSFKRVFNAYKEKYNAQTEYDQYKLEMKTSVDNHITCVAYNAFVKNWKTIPGVSEHPLIDAIETDCNDNKIITERLYNGKMKDLEKNLNRTQKVFNEEFVLLKYRFIL